MGYHDRHADVMELSVAMWQGGGDVTDEAFIPQHRILYFRKGDGTKVWDRKERLDLLFHSGKGSAKESEKKKDVKTGKKGNAENGANLEPRSKDGDATSDDDEEKVASDDVESEVKDEGGTESLAS